MSEKRAMSDHFTSNYVVCPQCQGCRKFTVNTGTNYPYACHHSSSDCAFHKAYDTTSATEVMPGRVCPTISSCNAFEAKNGGSSGNGISGGGGSGGVIGGFIKGKINSQMAANKAAARNFADMTGLGLVADAAGGIGKVARFAKNVSDKEAAKRAEIERQKQEKRDALQPFVDEKYQEVNSVIIDGDETALLGEIGELFGIMTGIKALCNEKDNDGEASLSYSDKWEVFTLVHQEALSKFDEAIEKLQGQSATGKIIGEFVDTVILSERPEEVKKEAGKKLVEKQKAKGLQYVEEIQIPEDAVACTELIIKCFDIIDMYKKHITAESMVDKKERNLILGPVRIAAMAKIDSALEKLHGLGSEGNAVATIFEEVLAVEKNLKFSDTTGKFHDKNNMPLLANVGDALAKLNPFAKKDKSGSDAGSGSSPQADSVGSQVESMKNKMGGLFGFGKKNTP
jgi:hypothetical protein